MRALPKHWQLLRRAGPPHEAALLDGPLLLPAQPMDGPLLRPPAAPMALLCETQLLSVAMRGGLLPLQAAPLGGPQLLSVATWGGLLLRPAAPLGVRPLRPACPLGGPLSLHAASLAAPVLW